MPQDPLSAGLELTPDPGPPPSARRRAWNALKSLAPELASLEPRSPNELPPPAALSDGLFIQLVACLADTKKRAILRVLLFDLLADDVTDLIENPYKEETT